MWTAVTLLIGYAAFFSGCRTQSGSETTANRESGEPAAEATTAVNLKSAPIMVEGRHGEAMSKVRELRDASRDGWDSEALAESLGGQLHRLAKLIEEPKSISAAHIADLVDDRVQMTDLRPKELQRVFRDASIEVARSSDAQISSDADPKSFVSKLLEMASVWRNAEHVHAKFKIIHVQRSEDAAISRALFSAYGYQQTGATQQNSTWECKWDLSNGEAAAVITSVVVSDYEEIVGSNAQHVLFSDLTPSLFSKTTVLEDQLRYGVSHWQSRLQNSLGLDFFGHQGIALGDVNQDGLDDIYLPQPGGLPNRLLIHQPDGSVIDASETYGVDVLDRSSSALLVDLNNDGYQDLALVCPGAVYVFENDRGKRFKRKDIELVVPAAFSISAADFDNDALLDLYVSGYSYPTGRAKVPTPYHDANNGYRNRLLHNEGNFVFQDVTSKVGLEENNRRYSFSASWEDYDQDGSPDLYVANDYGRNNLYRNTAGTFSDVAADAGVEDISAGMSVSWGDYNNDGAMDVYVSNMFSSAGQRVTYNRQFSHASSSELDKFQRHARGNSLFENRGDGTFEDVSLEKNVTFGRWAWGSLFVDINNDSWNDLVVCNGNLTGPDTDDL